MFNAAFDDLWDRADHLETTLEALVKDEEWRDDLNFIQDWLHTLGQTKERRTDRRGKSYSRRQSGRNGSLPLEHYDELGVKEVLEKIRVEGLTKQDIEAIRIYEQQNKNRKTLLKPLDRALA